MSVRPGPRAIAVFTIAGLLAASTIACASPAGWTVSPVTPVRPGDTVRVRVDLKADTGVVHTGADSLSLLVRFSTWSGKHVHAYPMEAADHAWRASFVLPDSVAEISLRVFNGDVEGTVEVPVEIAIPTARYAVRAVIGNAAADSDLQETITRWGDPFVGIFKFQSAFMMRSCSWCGEADTVLWNRVFRGLTTLVTGDPSKRPARYLLLAQINRNENPGSSDSLAAILVDSAFRGGDYDVLFEHDDLFSDLASPTILTTGALSIPRNIIHALRGVGRAAPRSAWAREWIRVAHEDTLLSRTDLTALLAAWHDAHDAVMLGSIGLLFADSSLLLHDPREALEWLTRALTAAAIPRRDATPEHAQPVYPWQLSAFSRARAQMLLAVGRPIEAIREAEHALSISTDDRAASLAVMVDAAMAGGFDSNAIRAYAGLAVDDPTWAATCARFIAFHIRPEESQEAFDDRMIALYGDALLPRQIPSFSFTTMRGDTGSLDGLHGRVVMIHCWEMNCGGCVLEEAALQRLCTTFAGDSVVFVSIARDSLPRLIPYLNKHPSCMPVVPNGESLIKHLGDHGYPTHFIVGHDGKTLAVAVGGSTNGDARLAALVRRGLRRMRRSH
jgi:thiol-disulfide isomerase/thioredoxin